MDRGSETIHDKQKIMNSSLCMILSCIGRVDVGVVDFVLLRMVRPHLHFNTCTIQTLDPECRRREVMMMMTNGTEWYPDWTHTILRGARDLTPRLSRPGSHWLTGWFLTPQHTGSGPLIGWPPGTSHLCIIIILLVCSEVQSNIRIFLVLATTSVRQSVRH